MMKLKRKPPFAKLTISAVVAFVIFLFTAAAQAFPITFTDAQGQTITIREKPSQVISLVPSITEIIFRVGAGDAVQAVTYHGTHPAGKAKKEIIGGFFSPAIEQIKAMQPDVIFYSRYQKNIREKLGGGDWQLVDLETDSIAGSYETIRLIGKIFGREKEAARIVDKIQADLKTIEKKVAKIPASQRKRVIRLMGRDSIMTPGDDSFQNELIRAAGGIPPKLGKKGNIVPVTEAEWKAFNPQVIYSCGGDREAAARFFGQPRWKDVDAVRNGKIFYFPCDLTCRVATNTGHFVSWLAARIYPDEFSKPENQVLEEMVFDTRPLEIDLEYVQDIRIAYSHIHDFINKTLIIDFKKPLSIVSTLEGQRDGIESVGNHYSSPPCWGLEHRCGLEKIRKRAFGAIGKSAKTASFLFTGADMDNLSIQQQNFKDMSIYALVTAGVASNAVRMSRDIGGYYEPGTINIILMTNTQLSKRAMTRAIIAATEAKTAALMDMDVRSSYSSRVHQATGTGTDNIIVVQGTGVEIDGAGGHTKMGELIAKAVYAGVQDAVYKQNGFTQHRNIFQRLKERNISIMGLVGEIQCDCGFKKSDLGVALEHLLLDPHYAGFIESSLLLSDGHQRGLLTDLTTYDLLCSSIAEDIAGVQIEKMIDLVALEDVPPVLEKALNAVLNGLYHSMQQTAAPNVAVHTTH